MAAKRQSPPRISPSPAPSSEATPTKVRATILVDAESFERARDAVVALSGPPDRMTLSSFTAAAFDMYVKHLQDARNRGRRFPRRESDLKGGRPLK